ncbi:MAG: hypothetical protein JWL68_823 [Actinomycetia bacterium]|nr:hypothetical protein [Actinomycetes bacterium]
MARCYDKEEWWQVGGESFEQAEHLLEVFLRLRAGAPRHSDHAKGVGGAGHGTGVTGGSGQRAGLLDEVDRALPTVIGHPRQETGQVQGLCERPVVTDSTHDRHGLDAEVDLTGGGVTASHLNGRGGQQRAGSRRRAFGRRG